MGKRISVLLVLILLAVNAPLNGIIGAEAGQTDSRVSVIPRGTLDNCTWEYAYDVAHGSGWESNLNFSDLNWSQGSTPIGWGDIFRRTPVSFRDLYVRKVVHAETVPPSAILNIASKDGAEVWVNGIVVLIDDSLHRPNYWDYRVDIADYLKAGDNLIAVHIYSNPAHYHEGECYFDAQLVFERKDMRESALSFVQGRQNPDGGFSDSHIEPTFYATSALKILGMIDAIDVNKTSSWIMSHRSLYGDFGGGDWWQQSAIGSLENMGVTLDNESAARLSFEFYKWQVSDGSWNSALWDTYRMIEALASLGGLGMAKNWSSTVSFIGSLQCRDGSFMNRQGDPYGYTMHTFHTLRCLYLLNATGSIDRDEVITYLMSCYKDGAFSGRPDWGPSMSSTFWAIESLAILNSSNIIDPERVANKVLSMQGPEGGFGNPEDDYYLVMTLRTLGKLYRLDKGELMGDVLKFYNPVDGAFKGRSTLDQTEHCIRILANVNASNGIDKGKAVEWISSLPIYNMNTADIHSAVYCLSDLGALSRIDKDRVVGEIVKHWNRDGGFGQSEGGESDAWETYLAVDTIRMLNAYGSFDGEKIADYVLSLGNADGSFNYSSREGLSLTKATGLAVVTLGFLGKADGLQGKTADFILSRVETRTSFGGFGGFGDALNTYLSLKALKLLNRLGGEELEGAVSYALSLQNLDGGFGRSAGEMYSWSDSTDYATSILGLVNQSPLHVVKITLPGQDFWSRVDGDNRTGASSLFEVPDRGHVIEAVDEVLEGGTRYIFCNWSDGSISNPRAVKLTRDLELTASYRTEFFVEALTNYSRSSGSGWVKSGDRATIGIGPTIVDYGNGTRRIFSGWRMDGALLSNYSICSFEVNDPMTLRANWTTEYEVRALSDRGAISGGGWYPAGTTATVTMLQTTITRDIFTNYVFDGWKANGTTASTTASHSFAVTGPIALTAGWKTELNPATVGASTLGLILAALFVIRFRKPKSRAQ